jgi:tryptophan-rich sensory protein
MNWISIVVSVVIAQAAGGIGGLFTSSKIPTWYATLAKPSWQPPSWVFGPVWTTLYFLMGYASAMVWARRGQSSVATTALVVYGVQLVLNVLWSILFFGAESPMLAFICIVALWFAIVLTMVLFWRVSHTAAWLMVPYLAWVSFAGVLNFTIWRLNA